MAERINKFYKPSELSMAITQLSIALQANDAVNEYEMAKLVLADLHKKGYRLVKTN